MFILLKNLKYYNYFYNKIIEKYNSWTQNLMALL